MSKYLFRYTLILIAFSSSALAQVAKVDSLADVVISGTMRPVTRAASPVPVEVYSPKFFMKNPTPNLFEAMQMVNGVRPQVNCNICNTGDIHINGLEGPYTMVLIDGMPIVSSLASVYGLSGIPNSLIERVEVVKGPASSLYGSEAIGGLINVITKSPSRAPAFSTDISTTSWLETNADLGVKYRAGNHTGLLGVSYFKYGKPQDHNHDHFTDVTLQDRISLFNKIAFKRRANRQANIAMRYVYEDRWGGEMNWNKHFRGGDSIYGESVYTSRVELIGNYELPTREKFMLSFSANQHDQNSAYGTTLFDARQQVAFGQLTWQKNLAKHSLLAAAVTRYTWYDDNTPATVQPEKVILPGLLLQDEIMLNPKQHLLLGVRYDYDSRHGNIVTPRLAYKYAFGKNDIFRLNAGTGFRVVNVFTEDHAALTGARTVVIADKLEPERSYNINANYLKKLYMGDHFLIAEFSAWYTYFTNRIVPDYTTNTDQIIYTNLEGFSESKGISANLEYGWGNRLRVNMGGSLMDVSIVERNEQHQKKRQRQMLTERSSATWAVSYTFGAGWSTDYTGTLYGPMLLPLLSEQDPRPPASPVWSIQNIQLTKKWDQLEIYGGVKNLLNWTPAKKLPFLIARTEDPFDKRPEDNNPYHLSFDPTYVYAPNQGLRVFLGLRYHLTH